MEYLRVIIPIEGIPRGTKESIGEGEKILCKGKSVNIGQLQNLQKSEKNIAKVRFGKTLRAYKSRPFSSPIRADVGSEE